ncbi:hypothetical protein IAU60_003905 [Kwoniella sp. DSM 27419]
MATRSTGAGEQSAAGPSISRPLSRQTSRLSNALTHVRSIEAYPPDDKDRPSGQAEEDDGQDGARSARHSGEDEKVGSASSTQKASGNIAATDIEHVPVDDDPREWSGKKKWFALMIVTFGLLGPVMAASIYNPVINELAEDLHATNAEVGLSLSMYILFQGVMPVLWAAISEPSYLVSYAIYIVALIVASRAKSMSLLIAMRALQAVGSGAVTAAGAGSLADMYDMHERGEKMGLFYGIPMLGPGVAPLLGGALGQAFGWRSVFYFLAAYAGVMEFFFIFFPDSWRKERSRVYQKAIKGAVKRAEAHERRKARQIAKKAASQPSALATIPASPTETPAATPRASMIDAAGGLEDVSVDINHDHVSRIKGDKVAGQVKVKTRRWFGRRRVTSEESEPVKLSLRDLNPLPTMASVLKRPTNMLVLTASGLLYAAQYTVVYTASITLGNAPYNYDSLKIGLVLLAFGVGNIGASIIGGRYSDVVLRRLKKKNGGVGVAEMRLQATFVAMPFLVAGFLAYAWFAEKTLHIAAIVVALFVSGFALLWIYSSTLAYLVDANPGVSASAVSLNSMFRGIMAAVMSQIAVPIRNAIGDGGLYTLFAGLLALSSGILVLLVYRGEQWRSPDHRFKWRFWKRDTPQDSLEKD